MFALHRGPLRRHSGRRVRAIFQSPVAWGGEAGVNVRAAREHGTGKFREPANRNVCATPRAVAPTFCSASKGDFPVASCLGRRGRRERSGGTEHGTGKFREPANRNVCATPRAVAPTFCSASKGDFPVARCLGRRGRRERSGGTEHGTGKFREPANRNVCATPRADAPTFWSAGKGDFPVASCLGRRARRAVVAK
jgi:hypothetical protein